MRNIKLTIEYDGTNYCGWQTQTGYSRKPSIQETVEKTLRKILNEKIKIIGSGRTDAGVHARAQAANFRTESRIPLKNLKRALNSVLPKDITIKSAQEAALGFHSRFDVKFKTYRYIILNSGHPDPFLRNYAYFYPFNVDVRRMKKESRSLLGRHNFAAFQASGSRVKDTVRTVKEIKIRQGKHLIYIDITADGFLYNMARNIVGTLLEAGRGKFAAFTAPARGLFLLDVRY